MSSMKDCQHLFSLCEVSVHNSVESCWIVFKDNVYDITRFLEEHPGGIDNLLEYAGCDVTWIFLEKGHSSFAEDRLGQFYIGQLILEERSYHHWEKLMNEEKILKEI